MIIDSMKKWKTKFFIPALLLCVGLAATVSYALTEDEENNYKTSSARSVGNRYSDNRDGIGLDGRRI